MILDKFSFGMGDRFGCQGKAQLSAVIRAKQEGANIVPVWNKSNREHSIIGTKPKNVRREADEAVRICGWDGPYLVDADHIGMNNVDHFVNASDFFTLDVADFIAKVADANEIDKFIDKYGGRVSSLLANSGIAKTEGVSKEAIRTIATKYLLAVKQAGRIYRHIAKAKGEGNFVTEVSMDETDEPQTPVEMLVILAAIADEGIPAQTIAPKFSGRFNKGVDYVGDVEAFAKEFEDDLVVLKLASEQFNLPTNLKLSVHSGSDKFSIYAPIREALKKHDAGLHIKTAGTTWLEELIGLAMAGGDGLMIAKEVYAKALDRFGELCGPYETVIDIDSTKLPSTGEVDAWDGERFAAALQHDQSCEYYDPNFRQLLHVGYKIAAEMGGRFIDALREHEAIIAEHVTGNIYARHIRPIFMG